MPYVLAFANQKGGVGKTTTCINVAMGLSLLKKKVLVVDYDPQGNLTSGFGIEKTRKTLSVYHVICENVPAEQAIQHTSCEGIDILPTANPEELSAVELEFSHSFSPENNPLAALNVIKYNYDFILIDCPPAQGFLTISALSAADGVFVPLQCEFFALEGLAQLINTIKRIRHSFNPSLQLVGILPTMFNGRLTMSHDVIEEIKKYYPDKLFKTPISRSVRVAEAPSCGVPVQVHDPKCKSSYEYNAVAKEIVERI